MENSMEVRQTMHGATSLMNYVPVSLVIVIKSKVEMTTLKYDYRELKQKL